MTGFVKAALVAALASTFSAPALAQQQPSTVSNMPFASTPLSGNELMYIVQNGGPRKIAVGSLATLPITNPTTEPANTVYAGPVAGPPALPAFRPLQLADLPLGKSNVILHVDNVLGADSATCGATTGSGACATPQRALNNLCANYYPLNTVPTIQFTAGQTYTTALLFSGGATVTGAEPQCIGIGNILIDGQGSTMTSTGNTLYCRYAAMGVGIRNLTISSSGAGPIAFRGGGCMLSIETGVTIGSAANGYPQILAYGGGQVATCPTTEARCTGNVVNISGGGGCFAQATNGGQIQIEGATVNLIGTPAYSIAFSCAVESGSTVSFFQSAITGTNATGDQFYGAKLGYTDTNAQGSLAFPGNYTTCTNTYLPGSTCGQNYFGARFSDPGLPTISGCGSGAIIQNYEPYSTVILGSGLATTNLTLVSSCRVTMATRTNYTGCIVGTQNGANYTGINANFVGPTSSANGYVVINFYANGSASTGSAFTLSCWN